MSSDRFAHTWKNDSTEENFQYPVCDITPPDAGKNININNYLLIEYLF